MASQTTTSGDPPALVSPANELAAPVIQLQALRHQYGDRTALDGVSFEVVRRNFRTARPQRQRQDHHVPHSVDPDAAHRRTRPDPGPRRGPRPGRSAPPASAWSSRHGASTSSFRRRKTCMPHRPSLWIAWRGAEDPRGGDARPRRARPTAPTNAPRAFSGGMQRRLELAKGLLHHPSVLLLDEPTTGLDPGARRDLWQYLQMLRDRSGSRCIVTTHLMEEAERCDRLAILATATWSRWAPRPNSRARSAAT